MIKKGGTVEIIVPQQATVTDGNFKCGIRGFVEQGGFICQGKNNTLTIELPADFPAFRPTKFDFEYAFDVPTSTQPTDPFIINLLDYDGNQIATSAPEDIQLDDLQVA